MTLQASGQISADDIGTENARGGTQLSMNDQDIRDLVGSVGGPTEQGTQIHYTDFYSANNPFTSRGIVFPEPWPEDNVAVLTSEPARREYLLRCVEYGVRTSAISSGVTWVLPRDGETWGSLYLQVLDMWGAQNASSN